VLNVFIRHANRVGMANVAQTVNVIAPIIATPKGSYCQPTFFPLKYYRQMHQDLAMDVNVETEMLGLTPELERAEHERYRGECPPHWSTDPNVWPAASVSPWPRHWVDRPLPLIDASATRSEDGRTVTVSVVNRHREQPQAVELDLFDFQPRSGRRVVISGPDPMGYSLEAIGSDLADVAYHPEACAATESVMERVPSRFTLEVPAHSIALVTLTA